MRSGQNSYTGRRKTSHIFVLQSVTDAPWQQKSSHTFTLWHPPHHPIRLLQVPPVLAPAVALQALLPLLGLHNPQSLQLESNLWLPATSLSPRALLWRFYLARTGTLGQVFYVLSYSFSTSTPSYSTTPVPKAWTLKIGPPYRRRSLRICVSTARRTSSPL